MTAVVALHEKTLTRKTFHNHKNASTTRMRRPQECVVPRPQERVVPRPQECVVHKNASSLDSSPQECVVPRPSIHRLGPQFLTGRAEETDVIWEMCISTETRPLDKGHVSVVMHRSASSFDSLRHSMRIFHHTSSTRHVGTPALVVTPAVSSQPPPASDLYYWPSHSSLTNSPSPVLHTSTC